MNQIYFLFFIILVMLIVERVLILGITHSCTGRNLVRKIPLLHPNTISLLRIPMGTVSVILLHYGYISAAVIFFAFWMISDLTDGTIARRCDLETETGKWLDPLSDKFMYIPCLLYLSFSSKIDPEMRLDHWGTITFVLIDVLGQASRLFSEKKAANHFGKAKTALVTILLITIAFYSIYPLPIVSGTTITYLLISCNILAFLSFYCKVIPDQWYANSLTFANLICGAAAIWVVCRYSWFTKGFVLIFVGQFFDLFDGRMARKYGSTKRGAFFDDVADATSFGLAAACIIHRALKSHESALLPNNLILGITLFYLICLVYRLYRFLYPTKPQQKGVFQGMPSPAGALLACSAVLLAIRHPCPAAAASAAFVVVFTSILMVSNVPYLHFGQSLWPNLPRGIKLLLLIVLIVFVNIVLVKKQDWEAAFVWLCAALSLLYGIVGIQYRKAKTSE